MMMPVYDARGIGAVGHSKGIRAPDNRMSDDDVRRRLGAAPRGSVLLERLFGRACSRIFGS